MYLEELVESDRLENDTFEAKSILNRDDVVGWLKTIAGFLQTHQEEISTLALRIKPTSL